MKVTIVLVFFAVGFKFSHAIGVGLGTSFGGLGGGFNIDLSSSRSLIGSGYGVHKQANIAASLGSSSSSSSDAFDDTGNVATGSFEISEAVGNSFSHNKVGSASAVLGVGLDVGLNDSNAGHRKSYHHTPSASSGSVGVSAESSSSSGAGARLGIGIGSTTKTTGFIGHGHKGVHGAHGSNHTPSAEGSSPELVSNGHRHYHGHKHGHIHAHRHGHNTGLLAHSSSTLDISAEKKGHGRSSSNKYSSTSIGGLSGFSASGFKDSKYESNHRLLGDEKESSIGSGVAGSNYQPTLYSGGKFGYSGPTISKDNSAASGLTEMESNFAGSTSSALETGIGIGLGLSTSSFGSSSASKGSSLGLGAGIGQNSYSKTSSSSGAYDLTETSAFGNVDGVSRNVVGIGINTGVGLPNSAIKKASAGLGIVGSGSSIYSSSSLSGSRHTPGYGTGNSHHGTSGEIGVSLSDEGSHDLGATGLLGHVGALVVGLHTDAVASANSATSSAESTGLLTSILGVQETLNGYRNNAGSQASVESYSSSHRGNYAGTSASSSGSSGGLSLGLDLGLGR